MADSEHREGCALQADRARVAGGTRVTAHVNTAHPLKCMRTCSVNNPCSAHTHLPLATSRQQNNRPTKMLPRMPFVQKTEMTKEERSTVKEYLHVALVPGLAGIFFLVVLTSATSQGYLDVKSNIPLKTIPDRLVFAARHLSLHLATILFSIYVVISYRLGTPAMNPLYSAEWESKMLEAKNVLTNNIEHGLVMMVTTLLTAMDLCPRMCARIIPVMTAAYVFARFAFFLGYPRKRIFGFLISNTILLASVSFNVFKLADMYYVALF